MGKDPFGLVCETVAPDGTSGPESQGERIQEFDSQMRFLGRWGSEGDGPGQYSHGIFGIAFDRRRSVWTADDGGHRLEV